MNTPQMIAALAALVLAVAALIKTLGGAFETRFSELRKELAQVRADNVTIRAENVTIRAELEEERRLRGIAEQRAANAERHVNELANENIEFRREVELMRLVLVGAETERNEALKELARANANEARVRTAGAAEKTGPHKVAK